MHDDPITRFLDAVCSGTIAETDVYATDAELDATVPGWRTHLTGAQAIKDEYAKWFSHAGTFIDMERVEIPGGELVIYELEWVEGGVRHRGHHSHRLTLADGKIVRDQVWCGGRWPEELLQRMAAG